jgi:16S rRNA (guanine527-N7)-methyltransferase
VTSGQFAQRLSERLNLASVEISDSQFGQLERYYELLRRWNRRVNLTSLELDSYAAETLDRLLIEPLVAASLLDDFTEARELVDLGSGGGSPGIPLAIVRPALRLTLVESRERKSAFLREACRFASLPYADVLTRRAEDMADEYFGRADVVSVRALRIDDALAGLVRRLLNARGCLLTFGFDVPQNGFAVLAERRVGDAICVRRLSPRET